MFIYFTNFYQRMIIMAIHLRNMISLVHGIRTYARPFDEIIYSYDLPSTSNTDNQCPVSIPTKDSTT